MLLAAVAAAALAKDIPAAGKASISGVVELPLYAGVTHADDGWYVEGTINEKPVLLAVSVGTVGVELTEAAAGRAKLKVAGKDEKTTKIPSMALGAATFTGLKASVVSGLPYGVDGRIGPTSFPGVAWAILPSQGKVKLGPAGASSVANEVGADVPYTEQASYKPQIGKEKQEIPAYAVLLDAEVSGVKMPAAFVASQANTVVRREVDGAEWFSVGDVKNPTYPLPAVDGLDLAETEHEWRAVRLAGSEIWTDVNRQGAGFAYRFKPAAIVGFDVIRTFDIGVDPSRHALTLKSAAKNASSSYAPVLKAALQAGADAPADPAMDAEAARAALAGQLGPLLAFFSATHQTDEAVALARRITEADPEHCSAWQDLGQAFLDAGHPADAVEPFAKAATLYDFWAQKPLSERTKLSATEARRAKSADFDGKWAQPSACFTSWSQLAVAYVASGQVAAVAPLYPAHLDLDQTLPLVVGNARLLAGNTDSAEAAYRQAVKLSYASNRQARSGMLLATKARAPQLALAQFQPDADGSAASFADYLAYADALSAAEGAPKALAQLAALSAKTPGNIPALLALANASAAAGADNHGAVAAAVAAITEALRWTPQDPTLLALSAEALRLSGSLADAATAAERASALDRTSGLAWFVRARIAESAGDSARAGELRKSAGMAATTDPLYAQFLGG